MKLDYWELASFEHIYLEDSWVRQITATPGKLLILVDLVLTEDHPRYQVPRAGEMYCYAEGVLIFPNVVDLEWKQQGMPPATDANSEMDFGGIDAFVLDEGAFYLEGDCGQISLTNDGTVSLIYTEVDQETE